MKKLLTLAFSLAIIFAPLSYGADAEAVKSPEAQRPDPAYTSKTPKLSREKFDALLAKPEKLLIIDVRRPDEISKIGSFPVYLSIQNKELEKSLPFIPRDRAIVTVSNHAHRAGVAGDFLAGKGFKVVGAVGSQNYEEEGGVITKIEIPPPRSAAPAPAPEAGK